MKAALLTDGHRIELIEKNPDELPAPPAALRDSSRL
jgi:hypothetical protein